MHMLFHFRLLNSFKIVCDIFAYKLSIDGVTHGLVYKIHVTHRRGAKYWGNTLTFFHE
jgi:hypothetical protein